MSTHFARSCALLATFLSGVAVSPLGAASWEDLLTHRAVYDLQLERAGDKTGITHLSGRMVYELSGSYCAGFTTHFRYVSRIEMEESAPRLHDQQTTLFEAGDGSELRISNKNYVNRELSYEMEAVARLQDDGIIVDITKPEAKKQLLPSALFPNAQMLEMLQQAEAGTHFYQTALYDDFESGDKITQAAVVIGSSRPLAGNDAHVWPVTVSYFDDQKNPDGLPSYSSRFLLDSQGVSRDLIFDYGDFSMRGTLTRLDILEPAPCAEEGAS